MFDIEVIWLYADKADNSSSNSEAEMEDFREQAQSSVQQVLYQEEAMLTFKYLNHSYFLDGNRWR